jgi:hypothetical protein
MIGNIMPPKMPKSMIKTATFEAPAAGRRPGRWSAPAIAVACLVLGAERARGADDVVTADVAAAQPLAPNVAAKAKPREVGNAWLFSPVQTAAMRATWEPQLARQLAELRRCCNLSDTQAKKMALAMQRDVDQFFENVDRLRERFPDVDHADVEEVNREMYPLQMRANTGELCGPDSFFEKTLPRVLDDEQLATYRAIVNERLRLRYLTAIDTGLLYVEERIFLDSRQHDTLRRLLAEQSLPRTVPSGRDRLTLIMYRISQLPEDQLKPLFDERHWKAFNDARMGFETNRDYLKQIGVLRHWQDAAERVRSSE